MRGKTIVENRAARDKNGTKKYMFLMGVYFLTFLGQSCYIPYLNVYYNDVGISGSLIGVLGSILPIVVIFIQPFWAKKGDETKQQQKLLIMFCIGAGFSVFLYMIKTTATMYIIITILFGIFFVSISSMLDVMALILCEQYNFRFSDFRMSATISYALGGLLFSAIIPKNLKLMFVFTGICYICAGILLSIMPKIEIDSECEETLVENIQEEKPKKDVSIFDDKMVPIILSLLTILYLAHHFSASYLGILLEEIGAPSNLLGYSIFINCLSEFPIIIFIDRILAKYNEITIMKFAAVIILIRMFLSGTGNLYAIIFVQFINGISYMLNFYCGIMYMNNHLPKNLRTRGQGAISFAQTGIGHIGGSLIGGFMYQFFGIKEAHTMIGIICVVLYIIVFSYLKYLKNKGLVQIENK